MTIKDNRNDDPAAITTGRVVKWALVGGIALAGLVTLGTCVQMATAPMRSASGLLERTLNPANVEATYERFHDRYRGYLARLAQIETHRRLVASERDPAELRRLRIELAGMEQSCRETVAGYNAEATMTNRAIFQGRTLPETLSLEACGG